MSPKQPAIALAAAALCAVIGSASVSAQENCSYMYRHVMEAYQTQSPYYAQMLNHYNARCLSGSSTQPGWDGDNRHRSWEGDNRHRHDYDRRDYNDDRGRRGW
jgi:hypothetical protein